MKKIFAVAVAAAFALPHRLISPRAETGFFEQWPGVSAAADLSGAQFSVVKLSGADAVALEVSAGTGLDAIGILLNKPFSGQAAMVAREGFTKAYAGAAIVVNKLLTWDTSGHVITCNSGDTKNVIGRALEAATNIGDLISIELHRPYRNAGAAI